MGVVHLIPALSQDHLILTLVHVVHVRYHWFLVQIDFVAPCQYFLIQVGFVAPCQYFLIQVGFVASC